MTTAMDHEARALLDRFGTQSGPATREELLAGRTAAPDPEIAGVPEPTAVKADIQIPVDDRSVPVRIYREGLGALQPLLIWLHGGGFCGGSLDDIDTVCAAIARRAGVTVLSIDYRLAPEDPFPAALDDAYGVAEWLSHDGAAIGGDGRIAIGGQSAGGNLAAATALLASERDGPTFATQILCYPSLRFGYDSESHRLFDGLLWDRHHLEWTHRMYLAGHVATPLAEPLLASTLVGLPPALVLTAGHDPYRDDGREYADRLRAARVAARHIEYGGTIHAFMQFPGALSAAWHAFDDIAAYLRATLRVAAPPSLQHVTTLYDERRLGELRRFYGDLVGFCERPVPRVFAGTGIVWFAAGGSDRELHFVPRNFPGGAPHVCVEVPDLGTVAARLEAAGIHTTWSRDIENRTRIFVHDPFDNLLEIATRTTGCGQR